MARAATIGNGSILIGLDDKGQVRDFYYPYVGHANHVSGASGSYWHRIGVWVDGQYAWFEEDSWSVEVQVHSEQMNTVIQAENATLGVVLHIKDVVHNEQNIFLRNVMIENCREDDRVIKLFFAQQFRISESRRGDTGIYDPRVRSVIHYKGHNVFLVHAELNGRSFEDYSIGIFDIEGKDGTFKDAEDGTLQRNSIEHGSVDSVIGLTFEAHGKQCAEANYWVAVGATMQEAHGLHGYVLTETPRRIRASVENYWRLWVHKENRDLSMCDAGVNTLYRKSLQIIRVHADNGGGIIASGDSEMLNHGRDNYSYVWPRDAIVAADAISRGGYRDVARRLFQFLANLIEPDGYLMHKYRVDGVLGSSWHPWVRNGRTELPIQEDETASVLHFLWQYYERERGVEFIESLYNPFIEPAAEFLCAYIDDATGLPRGSYDLWEEKYGTSTYTVSSVFGGLTAAARFSDILGKAENAASYGAMAERVKAAMLQYLYLEDFHIFAKLIHVDAPELSYDYTVDSSSFFGPILFGVLPHTDERLTKFKKVIDQKLFVGPTEDDGGYVRYEGDRYYTPDDAKTPNPWIVCTMWMAQYEIMQAKTLDELKRVTRHFAWVERSASTSGIMAEQIHLVTKEPLSTAPLVWSHSEYVIAVDEYAKKYRELSG